MRTESLHQLQHACWEELTRATREREHGWRPMTLATMESGRAEARSVILREADPAAYRLVFFTDARSPKLQQIQAHPQGTLLAWCPRLSWQIRLRVALSRETDPHLTMARWERLRLSPSAQDYLSSLAPGAPLSERASEAQGSREHFAMVNAQVQSLDWLELHPDGHRRAVFDAAGGRWVQP